MSCGNTARRRVWRIVRVEMGLLRHDGDVEGAVVEDDAVLVVLLSASVAAHAKLKRMSQNDDATIVFHVFFSVGSSPLTFKTLAGCKVKSSGFNGKSHLAKVLAIFRLSLLFRCK